MQKPPRGTPGNDKGFVPRRPILREAEARQIRRNVPSLPAGRPSPLTSETAGIHAAERHIRRSTERSVDRAGPNVVTPARQGKAGVLWSEEEITELRRLVGLNTNPAGTVSWVKVAEAWGKLNLPQRTRSGLSSKWRSIKSEDDTSAQVVLDETRSNQDSTTLSESTQQISGVEKKKEKKRVRKSRDTRPTADVNQNKAVVAEKNQPEAVVSVDPTFEKIWKKNLKRARKIGCLPNIRKTPSRVSGKHIKPIVTVVDKLIEKELSSRNGGCISWDQLSILVYAGAMTVSQIGNQRVAEKQQRSKEWFRNSNIEVESLRRTIGKATAELNRRKMNAEVAPTLQQLRNIKMLKKRYRAESGVDISSLVEKLKSRLQLLQSRIELRKADERRIRVRQMPTKFLLRGAETKGPEETSDVQQIRRFWKDIVGVKKRFDRTDKQLVAWKHSLHGIKGDDHLGENLNLDLWLSVIRKSKPWKAHGPDGIQGYWWKVFSSANVALYHLVLRHLTSGDPLPQKWIAEGRVVLIHKSGPRSDPANFRPIACLNTCYKLMTGFIAAYLHQYVKERQILPSEQVALQKGVWGCTHALILDQTMTADAQHQKQRPLSVAWIDYAKAFDSVPHRYVNWLLKTVRVPNPLKKFLSSLMKKWRIKYEVKQPGGKTERSSYLKIRSGVLQGDSFSPLLFCLAMAPISHAINSVNGHYKMASGKLKGLQTSLSHLFYMDDLKLYANSSDNLSKQLDVVASVSRSISMKLNVKKCAAAHFIPKRLCTGQDQLETADVLKEGSVCFPQLDKDAMYKYLGIEQRLGLKEADAWDRVKVKCCQLVRNLWESDLTFRQKVNSHNTTVIPIVSYVVSCIIKGSGKYMGVLGSGRSLDMKFRKILAETKARYKSGCVARLYLASERGGYGLRSVRDSIEESTIYSWAYLCTKEELKSSLNLFVSMANREKRCVISDAESVLKSYNINAEIDVDHSRVTVNGAQFDDARILARHVVSLMRTVNQQRRYEKWQGLKLAGRVLRSNSAIDVKTSFIWLNEGKLSSVAVRNVLAAQEGCLLTKAHPTCAKILTNTSCRACGLTMETIEHVVSNCSKWLPNLYIDRHDSVARNIHYKLCQKFDLTPPHYSQKVEPVLENDSVKLYWNQPVQTKTIIRHNKPDIIAFDKIRKTAIIIEVAISWFTGIERQIEIKENRYCVNGNWDDELNVPYPRGDNILRELETSGWKVTFIPIVIGATGETLSDLNIKMEKIGLTSIEIDKCIERLQRSAVLGTSRIIKNHLAIPGS